MDPGTNIQTDQALQRPTEAEWESHKSAIRRLYLDENKSLEVLINIMGETFNFYASKSKYETYFKKWGFQNNLTKQAWKALYDPLVERERAGKESEVSRYGKLMSQSQVRKETLSNRSAPVLEQSAAGGAPGPEVPSGLAVYTHVGSEVDWPRTANLPWFKFAFSLGRTEVKDLGPADQIPFRSVSSGEDLVFTEFEKTWPLSGTLRSPQLHGGLQGYIVRLISDTRIGSSTARKLQLETLLDAIIPEIRAEEHHSTASKILESTDQVSRFEITKFAIYLLSNNQVKSLCKTQASAFLRWLHQKGNTRLLESLLSVNLPTIRALKEAVFRISLRAEDIEIVRLVLRSGLDVNEPIGSDFERARTPLKFVCQRGNLEIARLLIKEGASVNDSRDSDGRSALVYAAKSSNTELIKMLIEAKAKVNPDNILEETALHVAASRDDSMVMETLLSAGACVDRADQEQETSLHAAACLGNINAIETLLEAGADIDATNERGETPLDLAFKHYISFLDEEGAERKNAEEIYTIQKESKSSVYCLLNARPGSVERVSALGFAVAEGDVELVRKCLGTGLHVNSFVPFFKPLFGEPADDVLLEVTALTVAAFRNKPEMVLLLLAEDADVDGCFTEVTPLQVALLHEGTEILQLLLRSGADVNHPAHEETEFSELESVGTALQTAAFKGHQLQCEILLKAGADVNAEAGSMGFTALQAAAQTQHSTLVKILLEAGAEINAPASPGKGLTALQAAVLQGNLDTVYYLLQKGADANAPAASYVDEIDTGGITALAAAAEQNNHELVVSLIKYGADVNGLSTTPTAETALTAAVHNRNEGLTSLLLASGAKADDSTALLAAIKHGDHGLLRSLLAAHAMHVSLGHPTAKGYGSAALRRAVSDWRLDLVRTLLQFGIDVNEPVWEHSYDSFHSVCTFDWRYALDAAVAIESPSIVQTLLDAGADPNFNFSHNTKSALQYAAYRGNPELVRMLLDSGANPNASARGIRGRTSLQAAAEKGHFGLVKMLLEAGADINAPPAKDRGVTALQAAAIGGYCGIVRRLLELGAEVNAEGAVTEGRTALEGASEHGRIDVLQLLLDNGALIEGPGRAQYGRAISFAAEWGFFTARTLLQSHHQMLYGCI